MITKSIFMSRVEAAPYDKCNYSFIFILFTVISTSALGVFFNVGLPIFTNMSLDKCEFIAFAIMMANLVGLIYRWCWYVNKDKEGLIKNGKVIKENSKSLSDQAIDFIKDRRNA